MVAEFTKEFVDFRPTPSISLQAVEIEEAVLGAILLDPGAIVEVENLPVQAFSISNHRQIFRVMLELHQQGLQPDQERRDVRRQKAEGKKGISMPSAKTGTSP